ncbi:MAG: adenylate kinase [Acidimicrobiia bacterium]
MKVSVVGNSGSGKSTFADALAQRLRVSHIELDAIFHQPGWTPLPDDQYRQRVLEETLRDDWVIDGNYSVVRDLVWSAADLVVILAYPRWLATTRVARRALHRVVTRRDLWNGNRETWRNLLSREPERNIILWSWASHEKLFHRYLAAMDHPQWRHLDFLRFTHPRQAQAFLDAMGVSGEV